MTNQTNFLVYQAFGIRRVLHEVSYSIASLSKLIDIGSHLKVFICTDSEQYLSELLPSWVQYVPLSVEQLKKWCGKKNYVHRIKPEILRSFSSNHNGNILYCDDDTVFLKSPLPLFEQIEAGRLIMHRSEGRIHNQNNPLFKKLSKFLTTYKFPGENVAYDMEMWNAGVMGFPSSKGKIFDKILPLIDDLYDKYERHLMEQVADAYFFGKENPLACEDYIFHYWNFKEFTTVLEKFFTEHQGQQFEQWSRDIDKISPIELIKPKLAFEQQPNWKRQLQKIAGKSWQKNL